MKVLEHSGPYRSDECPTFGCSRPREVRATVEWPNGQRRVVTACERHVEFYVARAVMRVVRMRGGQEAVLRHVDGD